MVSPHSFSSNGVLVCLMLPLGLERVSVSSLILLGKLSSWVKLYAKRNKEEKPAKASFSSFKSSFVGSNSLYLGPLPSTGFGVIPGRAAGSRVGEPSGAFGVTGASGPQPATIKHTTPKSANLLVNVNNLPISCSV
jgi:hypothetical protein